MLPSVKSGKKGSRKKSNFGNSESGNIQMTTQAQFKALAREALKAVKDKAPTSVEEMILPHVLDEIAEFTGEIMGKLTNIDAEDEKSITMAHGIVRDGLIGEVIKQLNKVMLDEADERITKLFEKK